MVKNMIVDNVTIGLVCAMVGAVTGFGSYNRVNRKEIQADTSQSVRMETKIDNIGTGVDSIRLDIKDHARKFDTMNERLTRCEESNKSGHRRLDEHLQKQDERKEII